MKIILSVLLWTILINSVEAQIDKNLKNTALIYSREKKGRQINKRSRNKIIMRELPGSWSWHNGIWKFEPNGKMQFYYRDTLRTAGTWKVRHGIFFTKITWPEIKSDWKNKVIYCSKDTIKFKRPESTNPDHTISMFRIKS